MASAIDPTKPDASAPATADVRANFEAAHDEIEALQSDQALLAQDVAFAQGTAEDAQANAVDAGSAWHELPLVAGLRTTAQSEGYEVLGGDLVDPPRLSHGPAWDRTVLFRAVLAVDGAGTAYAALYNLTDGVQVCELSTQSTTPEELTQELVPGETAGFPNEPRVYEVRGKASAGRVCAAYKCCLDFVFAAAGE